jgi:flagellar M-ring protein FliF
VTQGQNVPDGTQVGPAGGQQSNANRTDETVNNEISKTTRTEVTTPGKVTRLSVAVAVDGARVPPAKAGEAPKYTPRSEQEMAQITALVRSAAGINDERGDTVEVANVQFAKAAVDVGSEAPSAFAFDKNDIMRGVEILALALVASALVFFVARPLIKGIFDGGGPAPMMAGAMAGGGSMAVSMPGAGGAVALPAGDGGGGGGEATVDIARIQGSVNANAMKQVSEVVDDNPEQTVAVIRSWLQERR